MHRDETTYNNELQPKADKLRLVNYLAVPPPTRSRSAGALSSRGDVPGWVRVLSLPAGVGPSNASGSCVESTQRL